MLRLRQPGLGLALISLAMATSTTAQVFTPATPKPSAKANSRPVVRPVVKKPAAQPTKAKLPPAPPPPPPFVGIVPRVMTGAWSIDFVSGLLDSQFRAEISISGGLAGEEIGAINYWLMSAKEPSLACSSRLVLDRFENEALIMTERLGPKGIFCPGGRVVTVQNRTGNMWFSWTKVQNNRPPRETMNGWGTRRAAKPQ